MFTGIVEEIGTVSDIAQGADNMQIRIDCKKVISDAENGCSIAVNGVCLTVVSFDATGFTADVMQESLNRSNLGELMPGSKVNLERAVAVGARLSGHIVQGHVDGTGSVVKRTPGEKWEVVRITLPDQLARYVVEKGSIAVDGTSLTVSAVGDGFFEVSLIPTTLTDSILGTVTPGTTVNLEVDVLAKYIERQLQR